MDSWDFSHEISKLRSGGQHRRALRLPGEASRLLLLLLLMRLLGSFQRCCVCGQSGATIMCCVPECDRWFHLPCAKEGGCVNVYVTPFSSFCPEHRPEQEVEATPEPDTVCLICLEPVEDRKSFTTLVCPTCKRAWFHRDCIQGQALRAGAFYFQCPLCRDSGEFPVEMFILGIRVPFRDPTWEDNDAFADLGVRHSQCNARDCLYPGGREEAEEQGPWQLLLCSSCAAEGTHRRCSGLRNSTQRWECDSCAGLGTSARDETELNGPRPARQRRRSRQQGWAQSPPVRSRSRRDSSSRTRPRAERPRRRDTSSGTPPRRSRSRQQRRASTQTLRSRSRQDRSQRTAASAERPRHRGTWSGTSRRSSRSHQRRRTSTGTSNSSA
ncbi:PHD finger protein 7-like [Zonotrichia leucophrys gambelii]|uniref:PHD finger protein 7-like n=1 Tax=Zonotrichia leucophrys gambelii TaxID=257770 RepID=UPI0031405E84